MLVMLFDKLSPQRKLYVTYNSIKSQFLLMLPVTVIPVIFQVANYPQSSSSIISKIDFSIICIVLCNRTIQCTYVSSPSINNDPNTSKHYPYS